MYCMPNLLRNLSQASHPACAHNGVGPNNSNGGNDCDNMYLLHDVDESRAEPRAQRQGYPAAMRIVILSVAKDQLLEQM